MSATNSLHYKLCCEGAKWLRKQDYASYKIVVVELICIGAENPDVWGTNGFNSTLIEVKTSRADFLKDRKKAEWLEVSRSKSVLKKSEVLRK